MAAPRVTKRWAKPEDWERMKPVIKSLYKDELHTLKEVMSILESEHQFFATPRMYKSKLRDWGLSKYVRATEAVAILRVMEERQAAGKPSQVILRGEEVDLDRIKNYIRRNRNIGRLEKLSVEERSEIQEVGKELICRTPSPSPGGQMQGRGLLGPAEDVYRALSSYVDISFETGNWFLIPDGRMRSKLGDPAWYLANIKDLWNRVDMAADLVGKTDKLDLVRLLDPAFGYMTDMVRHQYPRSISFLLSIFEELYSRGRGDLVDMFLRHVVALSEAILGLAHPHTRLWQSILAVWADEHDELLERYWGALLDKLRQQGVRSTLLEIAVYTDYYDCLLIRSDLESQVLSLQREVAKLAQTDDNNEQSKMLYLRHATAVKELHMQRGEYTQAATAMDYLVQKGDWDMGMGIQARGEAALAMGDWEAAESFYQEAKEHIHINHYWKDEAWVQNVLTQLEMVLEHNGKEQEAQQVLQMKLDHIQKLQA